MQKKSFLKIYGLIPFLLIVFINAFVDLGHKIIIQNTIYKAYEGSEQLFLNAIVNALILLPFILMLSPSGFLADKYPKNIVMKISAIFNVILTLIICICYYSGAFWMAFIFTFIMGAQAAIYSPSKYGFIKELVGKDFLAMGNGVINAVSIVAILAGMALFSLSFESLYSSMYNQTDEILKEVAPLGIVLILFSCIEVFFACRLPKLKQTNKDLVFNKKDYIRGKLLINNLKLVFKNKTIWFCIIGISFFWAISQLYLVSFPVFAKNELFIENTFYVQISLAFSGIGVILGSLVAGKFSKNYIELGLIPLGASGMFLMVFLMPCFISLLSYSFLFFFFG
ncbi:MFS transporter, partial [Campylobacter jejuni]